MYYILHTNTYTAFINNKTSLKIHIMLYTSNCLCISTSQLNSHNNQLPYATASTYSENGSIRKLVSNVPNVSIKVIDSDIISCSPDKE